MNETIALMELCLDIAIEYPQFRDKWLENWQGLLDLRERLERGTPPAQENKMLPEHFEEIELGMSNFDHVIDDGFEDALVGRDVFGIHAGWNFNGKVYHIDGKFYEDVWVYHAHRCTMEADTLKELMANVSDKFGYD